MRSDVMAATAPPTEPSTPAAEERSGPRAAPAPLLDAGWLFLVAGLALLGATILIPAADDLSYSKFLRDRALLIESHRQQRISRYEEFLHALEERNPTLLRSLAVSQLGLVPATQAPLLPVDGGSTSNVSVFPGLEPPELRLPEYRPVDSLLARWTRDDRARLWLILCGAVLVLIGLLPPSRGWRRVGREAPRV